MNKKIRFSLLTLLVMLCGTVFADSFTITFKDCGQSSDSTTGLTSTTISDYVADGADYIASVAVANKIYNAQTGYGLKFGSSSSGGSITLTLATPIKPTSIVMNASQYGASEGTGLLQGEQYDMTNGGGKGKFNNYTKTYDGETEVTTIVVGAAKRGYVKSVTVNYEAATPDPTPAPAPYAVDFNTAITTSAHDFAVASNWGHIVGKNNYDGYGPYYMSYSYSQTGGIDGTGALSVGAQNGYYMGSTQSEADFTDGNYDYLITPKVNGAITMQVKRYAVSGYASYVKIFKVNEAGTTVGDEVTTVITPDITDSDWSTVSLTLTEETRLAIRAQSVLIDNFTAASATIAKVPAMTISSLNRADGESTTYFDMNADGSYTVQYKVKITNTGEVDLVAGTTENYTLSVSIDGTVYGSFAIPVNVAIGETSEEFVASIVVPAGAPTGWKYRYVKENLTGTMNTASLTWSNTIEYNPVAYFIKKGNEPISKGRDLSSESSIDFGMISEATTLNYVVFANNAGNLQVKSIVAPEGFTAVPTETLPYTIAPHTGMYVDVTANGTATAQGNLVITYVDKNGADATVEVALSQTVIDASKWMANFANNEWPDNTVHQSSLSIASSSYYGYDCAVKSNYSYSNKFISPKLHATAGEEFTFDAMLDDYSGNVKVYLTTDRAVLGDPALTLNSTQLSSSAMKKQTLTATEEGDYYVVFEIYKAFIDNLYGFEKVPVTHDIMVNSYILSGTTAEAKTIQTGDVIKPTFEILPVQAELADAYIVKLYAGSTPVDTVASSDLIAGTTKKFTFEWTPNITETTVYETYAAIEFTDGTIVKSAPLSLTVTCEPVFVFFDAGTAVNSSKPSNRSKAITFGTVNEANLVQNFEIYNFGTAPLTVKNITVPEGFSVNVNEATVQSKERQAVNITFSATTPGTYSGNLAITYVDKDGADQTFELSVSGRMLDQTLWYASFNNTTDAIKWPAGSVYESNISSSYHGIYADNNYHFYVSSATTKNKFITPKLQAAAGDKFSFDVAPYSTYYNGSVKVYLSTDRENWGEAIATIEVAKAANDSETSTFTSKEVTIAEAGEYYIAIEPYYANIDDLYGLKLVNIAHDWTIASSSIPTEAMQNTPVTASLSILNRGLQADADYTIIAHIGEDIVESAGTVVLPMENKAVADGTTISATYRYPKIGTYPVYIEVKTGDYSVKTAPVNVTFAEEVAKSDAEMAAGSPSNTNLLHMNWNNSESVSLYSKAVLADMGLVEGSKIASITYKGYNVGSKNYSSTLNVWYEFTDDETLASPAVGKYDTSAMTNVLSTTRSWATAEGSADNLVDLITINFETPIVYTGKGLKLVVCSEADSYQSGTYFVQSTKSGSNASYYHRDDTHSSFEQTNSWSSNNYLPAISIGLSVEPTTISGTVKNAEGAVIEGATITLISNDGDGVEYTGKTDAEGAYSINVIQNSREYEATATAEGYSNAKATVTFGGTSKTKDFVLAPISLDMAAGWQEISVLPENLGDYYYTIADGSRDMMLALARGKNQGKEYNGLYYVPGADPLKDKSLLFTMEAKDGNVVLTNAEYNKLMLQTEWNAAWNYRTHDNGGGDKAWGMVKFTYQNDLNGWTIKNGKYAEDNGNYLGPWDDNAFEVGKDLALNKGADKKGVYRLFAISKHTVDAYTAALKATTGDNPVDMTALIVNPNARFADNGAPFGWTTTGAKNINTGVGPDGVPGIFESCEWSNAWTATLKQTIQVPDGFYELKAKVMASDGVETYLTANDAESEKLTVFGDNPRFQSELSVQVKVVGGQLTIGYFAKASAAQNWMNADNFTLTYLRGIPVATESDYAALTEAVSAAETKTLGFAENEYAPYANVEAVKALTAAKAINMTATNTQEYVQQLTEALTAATWTANTEELNAVYNGDFALCENDGVMPGWQTSSSAGLGGAYHSRAFVLTEGNNNFANLATFQSGEKHSAAYFRFDGTNSGKDCVYTYGKETGYTMPLKAALYKMTGKLGGWGQVDKDITIAIVNAEGLDVETKTVHTPSTGVHAGGEAIEFEITFTPATAGNYSIQLRNTNTSIDNAIIISNIVVKTEPLAGDANLNGEVTTSDAVAAVSFALKTETPSEKAHKAADVDKSGDIDVADVVAIVNIALEIPEPEPTSRGDMKDVNFLTMNGNALELMNTTEFVGFQMDVTLANGAMLNGVSLAERAAGLQVAYNRIADNTYRIIAFSTSNAAIEGNEGELFSLDITGNANVNITNIKFADAAARAYALSFGETTGIKGIYAGATNVESYTVGGIKNDKVRKGMNVVRTADGKVKKVYVK